MNQILRDNIRNVYRSLFSKVPALTRPDKEFSTRNFNVIESWIDEEIKKGGSHTEIAIRICSIILLRQPFTVSNSHVAFISAYLYLQTISKENLGHPEIPKGDRYTDAEIAEIIRHWTQQN